MIEVAKFEDVPEGGGIRVRVGNTPIALFKVEGVVHAIHALCPHAGGYLHMGDLQGHVVTCPLHGWDFDVRTGQSPSMGVQVARFAVEVRDGAVFVEV